MFVVLPLLLLALVAVVLGLGAGARDACSEFARPETGWYPVRPIA